MMFKKFLITIFLISSVLVASGCSPKLTKAQAIKIVKSDVENDGMGKIKIIFVTHKFGKYVVKWERKSNCENGTEYVSDRSGKLSHGIQSIC
jgi:hypothetical protein